MNNPTRRGQTGPLGLILVFSIMIVSTTIIVGVGVGAIDTSQQRLQQSSAESAMTQLDSKAAMVAIGSSETQQVDLPSGSASGYTIDESAGHITVESSGSSPSTLLDADLGAMTYENGGSTVAYQGGGVWKQGEGGGAVMVSPPEFQYRGSTLTLPIVTVSGDEQVTGRASISRTGTVDKYPTGSMENPVPGGDVTVTVQSKYYQAWGQYFESRTEGGVTLKDGSNEAVVKLQVPSNNPAVSSGVVSGASSSSLELKSTATVDSYDSTSGDYDSTKADNGKVTTAGDITLKQDATIDGDVEVGGSVTMYKDTTIDGDAGVGSDLEMKKDARIKGNLIHSGSGNTNYHNSESTHVDGTATKGSTTVPGTSAVGGLISQRVADTNDPSENDNSAHTSTINALENGNCATTTCELTAGQYYVSNVDLTDGGAGTDLEFDTSSGDITLVVNGPVTLSGGSKTEVTGSNRVNIYTTGSTTIGNSAEVVNAGDDAPQFWIYMEPTASASLKQDAEFTGVLYGPGSGSAGAAIKVNQGGEVYGALVGNVGNLNNDQQIHYDSALQSADTITIPGSVPTVRYLHISEHQTKIEG